MGGCWGGCFLGCFLLRFGAVFRQKTTLQNTKNGADHLGTKLARTTWVANGGAPTHFLNCRARQTGADHLGTKLARTTWARNQIFAASIFNPKRTPGKAGADHLGGCPGRLARTSWVLCSTGEEHLGSGPPGFLALLVRNIWAQDHLGSWRLYRPMANRALRLE